MNAKKSKTRVEQGAAAQSSEATGVNVARLRKPMDTKAKRSLAGMRREVAPGIGGLDLVNVEVSVPDKATEPPGWGVPLQTYALSGQPGLAEQIAERLDEFIATLGRMANPEPPAYMATGPIDVTCNTELREHHRELDVLRQRDGREQVRLTLGAIVFDGSEPYVVQGYDVTGPAGLTEVLVDFVDRALADFAGGDKPATKVVQCEPT